MKKIIALAALGLLIAAPMSAQTVYDAAKITNKDLNGTARFVGMGGAMGALGGDISTIGTNPAGIGVYRSNDAMVSFGFSSYGTESNYVGNKMNSDKMRASFDNAGLLSSKIGNATALRYVNFGFNYHKAKSFYKNMSMGVIWEIIRRPTTWLHKPEVSRIGPVTFILIRRWGGCLHWDTMVILSPILLLITDRAMFLPAMSLYGRG